MAFKPSTAGASDFASQSSSGEIVPASLGYVVRRDADSAPVADGLPHPAYSNQYGRLKVSALPGYTDATTGTITANAQTVFCDCKRVSNVMLHVFGTFAGVNLTFEGSINSTNGVDGNWFAIQAVRSNANTIELTTGVLGAAPAYAWELSVNGLTFVRVRATAFTSGTQNVVWQPAPFASEPIPAAQVTATQPVSGTVTATVTGATVVGVTPTASIVNSAANTNGTVVKATAGTLYSIAASNTNAQPRYLKLHNSASVTAGTTAVALTITIPANDIRYIEFGPQGQRLGTGICLSITGAAADNDTTAIGAGEVKVLTSFI